MKYNKGNTVSSLKQPPIIQIQQQVSHEVRQAEHLALFVDSEPVFLLGNPCSDNDIRVAQSLTLNESLREGLQDLGYKGQLHFGVVHGQEIDWNQTYNSLVRSDFSNLGLNLTPHSALSNLMCTNESIIRSFEIGESFDQEQLLLSECS